MMKRISAIAISLAVLTFTAVSTFAKTKPTVVIIRADWCSACQKLEPEMMGLMKEYGDKINFIVLDVTNDATTAQAAAKARSLGYGSFFNANKKTTSTVAVFKGKKVLYKTAMNFNRADYVAAFDRALK
ncbi:MAG: thioredoxin domain-containing protein [Pyrinomonadaceae bacterium]